MISDLELDAQVGVQQRPEQEIGLEINARSGLVFGKVQREVVILRHGRRGIGTDLPHGIRLRFRLLHAGFQFPQFLLQGMDSFFLLLSIPHRLVEFALDAFRVPLAVVELFFRFPPPDAYPKCVGDDQDEDRT